MKTNKCPACAKENCRNKACKILQNNCKKLKMLTEEYNKTEKEIIKQYKLPPSVPLKNNQKLNKKLSRILKQIIQIKSKIISNQPNQKLNKDGTKTLNAPSIHPKKT